MLLIPMVMVLTLLERLHHRMVVSGCSSKAICDLKVFQDSGELLRYKRALTWVFKP